MIKVLTYGTYDCLHYGHIRLLERAKALGDYLIVGVTSEDFDVSRGKINVKQSLAERIDAVRKTGLADKIIVEEYTGQKIDDIQRYDVDIFTVGSDWEGKFDYLNEYCQVVYLLRTQGVSSTELRTEENKLKYGIIGDARNVIEKFIKEGEYVNGLEYKGLYCDKSLSDENTPDWSEYVKSKGILYNTYDELLNSVDAVFVASKTENHYAQIKEALHKGKHVICESPVVLSHTQYEELKTLSEKKHCILREAIKTAFSLAFNRMLLLIKTGIIGDVLSVDATCTSLMDKLIRKNTEDDKKERIVNNGSMNAWAPAAFLAVFKILGTEYKSNYCQSFILEDDFDLFTKMDFVYPNAVASIKVGKGIKSEGELIISGTKGYIYVPSPWWKMDYFEVRYENTNNNQRYFYQLKGEGIRNMIVDFVKACTVLSAKACVNKSSESGKAPDATKEVETEEIFSKEYKISEKITEAISKVMEDYHNGVNVIKILRPDLKPED